MSVDIAWDTITSGSDGKALAETIRAFVHTKFQQVVLPRFINSVHVHSFEFGSACPQIEIKDICDPLPDFYEDDEADEEEEEDAGQGRPSSRGPDLLGRAKSRGVDATPDLPDLGHLNAADFPSQAKYLPKLTHGLDFPPNRQQYGWASGDLPTGPFLRSGTPGIPGGTSNLSYFHMPMSGLSGTQTPLAAVASGTPLSHGAWHQSHFAGIPQLSQQPGNMLPTAIDCADPSTRPSTANTLPSPPDAGSPVNPASPVYHPLLYPTAEKVNDDTTLRDRSSPPPLKLHPSQPSDLQVVAHVQYSGDVHMVLTAEILLDYPMPSFVGIPLKLSITGMTFDGVAILAYIKKRMQFCFLDPEDAAALVNDHVTEGSLSSKDGQKQTIAGLLREIHVESEIGRQESGKQVLKNVGKVEKFVLEQVRRIFEEEFVFPSFWTFLV